MEELTSDVCSKRCHELIRVLRRNHVPLEKYADALRNRSDSAYVHRVAAELRKAGIRRPLV
jgi:4-hydroxy-L-threonine phosphate dehydrogenase PdxA